jgi:hypothetical protein
MVIPSQYPISREVSDTGSGSSTSLNETSAMRVSKRFSSGALSVGVKIFQYSRDLNSLEVGICLTQVAPTCSMRG